MGGKLRTDITGWEVFEVIVYFVRVIIIVGLIVLYTVLKIVARRYEKPSDSTSEATQPLLGASNTPPQSNGHTNGHAYGTANGSTPHSKEQPDAWAKPTETPIVTWYSYLKGFAVLLPYLWPRKSLKLQALALSCFCLMAAQRVINVFVPIYSGKITDALSGADHHGIRAPWIIITIYILFRWLQGGQGVLGAARSILWVPVEQVSTHYPQPL